MLASDLPTALWRRRRTLGVTFLACLTGIVAVTLALPKSYEATATLLVEGTSGTPSDQVLRSFSALAGNPNTADAVRRELPFRVTRSDLLSKMSFTPVDQTQLFEISASDRSAARAKVLANIYASVFTSRAGQRLAENPGSPTISVSEAATAPTSPAKPDVPVYIGLGALLSLVLAVGAALLRERLDPRFAISPTATDVLGQPVLTRIPAISLDAGGERRAVRDSIRLLKVNIDLSGDEPPGAVSVMSAAAGEGKSTVAVLLATAHAKAGDRVVLVEADFRRPAMDHTVGAAGLDRAEKGLSDYFGGTPLADVIVAHPRIADLDVIWAGQRGGDSEALPGAEQLTDLVGALRLNYRRIVVDTPAIGLGADALLVATAVDGTAFVVDVEHSDPATSRAALVQLENVRANVLGVVVNHAELDPGVDAGAERADGAETA